MKYSKLLIALVLVLASGLHAQAEQEDSSLFYRAFYQESALRDFEAAADLYARFQEVEAVRGDTPLLVRAFLGSARCALALGRAEEAREMFARARELAPENAEAQRGVTALDTPSADDDLQAHIQTSIQRLASAERQQAIEELLVYGTKAVPALADGLRSPKAGVVDLCAEVLVILARRKDEAARDAYGRALEDPTVLLRAPLIENLGDLSSRVSETLSTWRRLPGIPEPAFRRLAFHHLFVQMRKQQRNGFLVTGGLDEPLLDLWRHVRDREPEEVQAGLVNVIYAFAKPVSPAQLEVLQELVGRGLFGTDDGLRSAARSAVRYHPEFYEAHRTTIVREILEHGEALSEHDVDWVQGLVEKDHVPSEDVAALLASDLEPIRSKAFWALYKRRERDAEDWPPAANRHVASNVVEWVAGRMSMRMHNRVNFAASFRDFQFAPEELVSIWKAYQQQDWGGGSKSRGARSSRNHLLTELLAGLPEAERAARIQGVFEATPEPTVRADLLEDVAALEEVPPIFEVCRAAASDPDPEVRSSAYRVLTGLHDSHPERVRAMPLPHLGDDVVAGNWKAASIAVRAERQEHAATIRRGFPGVPTEDCDRVLAALIGLEGIEGCRNEILERFGAETSPLTGEDRIDVFGEMCWALNEFIGQPHQQWLDLAELLRNDAGLLSRIVDEMNWWIWTPEEGGRLLRMALADAGDIDEDDLANMLGAVSGTMSMEVPVEMVLPYLRHRDGHVRNKAKKAFDTIREYEAYRNAAVSFGADARARAIAAIQENVEHIDPLRRRAAAHGIAALGDPGGIALLFDLVGDSDEGVRQAAVAALERMGSQIRVEDPPAERTEDGE